MDNGTLDITLICPPSAEAALTAALGIHPSLTSLPLPSPKVLAPKGLDQNADEEGGQTKGTAEILRLPEVRDLVTSDFVVLPCDLVCELGGDKLLQAWMVKAASLSDLFGDRQSPDTPHHGGLGVWYETKTATPVKGEETDFIATTQLPAPTVLPAKGSLLPHIHNLVYSIPTDSLKDLTDEKHGLGIRYALLREHPKVCMMTTRRDAHIYIFPRWVMDFVNENERMESIGEDVIGWWAKAGWQAGLAEKLGVSRIFSGDDKLRDDERTSKDGSPPASPGSEDRPRPGRPSTRIDELARPPSATDAPPTAPARLPPLLAYLHPSSSDPSAPLIRRVDTAPLLLAVSLRLAKLPSVEEVGSAAASPLAHPRKVAYPEGVKPRTTITRQDSLVAENVTVEEKTAIKESVVGAGCQLSEGAKLSQCLLMDGVVVGKNCKLTRCILGRRSQIGDGCVLTDCEVQENLLVEAKSKSCPPPPDPTRGEECNG